MNIEVARKRIKDVLNVDSINSSQSDFLSTHVPFRKISVTNDLVGTPVSAYISEEEIYAKYFSNSDIYNKHQLIVVEGSSGSGKSHFIRWICARLAAQEEQKDVVLMIRRNDNTLKGTIKQFLDIDEVKNLKNKDIYERLVRANQNVSENKFKYEIYHKFIVEIEDNMIESGLSSPDRKNLRELLSSSEFEERMLMAGGPIDRIYSKIVNNSSEGNEDTLALFEVEDFTMDFDFNEKLRNNASKRAIKMANKLLPEADGEFVDEDCNPEIITKYMNSMVETVVQSCAGIEPGDFQQIFKEIRQELYSQGKNLVLLIEDITSCTGINQDLLNALIVEHTGSNEVDHMCRLVSVIGTTSEYFKEFRDNYIDRISTKIIIEDGAIGNNTDDLIQFVAKYLNVMSIEYEKIENWYRDGALESDYPVHKDTEVSNWETYDYNGRKLSLYPFNESAIINLYNSMDQHKTPRYILRKIIEPAVNNIMDDKEHFPKFLKGRLSGLNFDVEARIKSTLSNLQVAQEDREDYRDRVLGVIRYWGDGTLNVVGDKNNNIGGIGINIFKEFLLVSFAEKILGLSIDKISDEDFQNVVPRSLEVVKPVMEDVKEEKVNKPFEDFARIINDWHYEGNTFTKAYKVREEICKFIFSSIEWQREGVPLISVQMVENSICDLVSIERQDRGNKSLIDLKDSDETYQLLLCFGKWLYIGKGSWNFPEAASSLRFVTSWLERNKSIFVEVVKGIRNHDKYTDYIKCAIVAEVYRCIMNGDGGISKLSDISPELLLRNQDERVRRYSEGHTASWNEFVDNIIYSDGQVELNNNLIQSYFNIIQGKVKNARRKIINYSDFESVFKDIKKNGFKVLDEELEEDKIKGRNTSKEYMKKILKRINQVAESEISEAKDRYKTVLNYFGFDEDIEVELDDIKELLNEIIDFYKAAESNGLNIEIRTKKVVEIKEQSSAICSALSKLNMDFSNVSTIEKLIHFSKDPMKVVKVFIELLENVSYDMEKVNNDMKKEKEILTRSGNWSDDVDPRFNQYEYDFNEMIKSMEV